MNGKHDLVLSMFQASTGGPELYPPVGKEGLLCIWRIETKKYDFINAIIILPRDCTSLCTQKECMKPPVFPTALPNFYYQSF